MLGPLDKQKLTTPFLNLEEINKIIINEEKNILYGTVYIKDSHLDTLLQSSFDLKTKM